jgi:hypothetical protein
MRGEDGLIFIYRYIYCSCVGSGGIHYRLDALIEITSAPVILKIASLQ